jgi:hypothetical protein
MEMIAVRKLPERHPSGIHVAFAVGMAEQPKRGS